MELLNDIGVYYNGEDKLQWSVVYDLSDASGKIWPHRDAAAAWDFRLTR